MSTPQRFAGFLQRESHAASVTKGFALRNAAKTMMELDIENKRLRADQARLEWLLQHLSEEELLRLGIDDEMLEEAGGLCTRELLDGAARQQEEIAAVSPYRFLDFGETIMEGDEFLFKRTDAPHETPLHPDEAGFVWGPATTAVGSRHLPGDKKYRRKR